MCSSQLYLPLHSIWSSFCGPSTLYLALLCCCCRAWEIGPQSCQEAKTTDFCQLWSSLWVITFCLHNIDGLFTEYWTWWYVRMEVNSDWIFRFGSESANKCIFCLVSVSEECTVMSFVFANYEWFRYWIMDACSDAWFGSQCKWHKET